MWRTASDRAVPEDLRPAGCRYADRLYRSSAGAPALGLRGTLEGAEQTALTKRLHELLEHLGRRRADLPETLEVIAQGAGASREGERSNRERIRFDRHGVGRARADEESVLADRVARPWRDVVEIPLGRGAGQAVFH